MNRRGVFAALGAAAVMPTASSLAAPQESCPAFWKTNPDDVAHAANGVRRGRSRVLSRSAGGRDIHLVSYGPNQLRRGTANYG